MLYMMNLPNLWSCLSHTEPSKYSLLPNHSIVGHGMLWLQDTKENHQSPPASKYQCPSTKETNLWCSKCLITTFESQKVVVSVPSDIKQLFKSPMAFKQPLEYQVAVTPRNHFQRVSHICIENALSLYMVSGWQYEKCSVGHHPHQFL